MTTGVAGSIRQPSRLFKFPPIAPFIIALDLMTRGCRAPKKARWESTTSRQMRSTARRLRTHIIMLGSTDRLCRGLTSLVESKRKKAGHIRRKTGASVSAGSKIMYLSHGNILDSINPLSWRLQWKGYCSSYFLPSMHRRDLLRRTYAKGARRFRRVARPFGTGRQGRSGLDA